MYKNSKMNPAAESVAFQTLCGFDGLGCPEFWISQVLMAAQLFRFAGEYR
jgi:hypothetical protein